MGLGIRPTAAFAACDVAIKQFFLAFRAVFVPSLNIYCLSSPMLHDTVKVWLAHALDGIREFRSSVVDLPKVRYLR